MTKEKSQELRQNSKPPITGMVNILEVWYGDKKIGHGFMLFMDGMFFAPVISDFEGKELEPAWYQLYTVEQRLVVVSRTIH